jgi:hypothetical protein
MDGVVSAEQPGPTKKVDFCPQHEHLLSGEKSTVCGLVETDEISYGMGELQ